MDSFATVGQHNLYLYGSFTYELIHQGGGMSPHMICSLPVKGGLNRVRITPYSSQVRLVPNRPKPQIQYASVASGDLRNTICTVNNLPQSYSGRLTIVLNDRDPQVTYRNIVLLKILGSNTDEKLAAELALQLWYSVCIPAEYHAAVGYSGSQVFTSLEEGGYFKTSLGPNSEMSGRISQNVVERFVATMTNYTTFQIGEASREYERVTCDKYVASFP